MRYFTIETSRIRLTWEGPRPQFPRPPLVVEAQTLDANAPPALHCGTEAPGITEQTRYRLLLESRDGNPVTLRHANPSFLRDLHALEQGRLWHGSLHFGTYAGRTAFIVWHDGRPHLRLELEIFPTRLSYRSDYEAMLADLETWTVEPALRFGSGVWQHGRLRTGPPDHPPGWIARLAATLRALERAFRRIAQRPLTEVQWLRQWQPLEAICHPDAALRRAVQTGSGQGPEVRLAGRPAHRIQQAARAVVTTDTPEHRWLAWQLNQALRQVQQLTDRLTRSHALARTRRQILRDLTARLEALQQQLPPATLPLLPPPPTPRLLRAEGYRQAYRIFRWLQLRLSLLNGLLAFEVGQIHTLYEYWCYLTLVRLLSRQSRCPLPLFRLFTLSEDGLQVRPICSRPLWFALPDGSRLRLIYNPRWGARSLLVPQQPDLLLSRFRPGHPPVHYVLDAKYRLDASPAYVRRYGVPGPPMDALNDLHRYRDALSSYFTRHDGGTVAQALALYPYRDGPAGCFAESRLARALSEDGVGALPLLPGATEHLEAWLQKITA
ncbi:DUF2357 domain-containing protein [Rhodothermus profundi]|uniref:DUF2357 domain-containing protein n=1 Tax=Rhodothermus profundi TaxID=633813 RepID=A0A1M6W1S1_9BACT|nr:DUF2357 domain-containing protein [Rhodothermus profundi]SHK87660.1 hypothetical protein SAMN04488087_2204 [Rhodothermus profundi]